MILLYGLLLIAAEGSQTADDSCRTALPEAFGAVETPSCRVESVRVVFRSILLSEGTTYNYTPSLEGMEGDSAVFFSQPSTNYTGVTPSDPYYIHADKFTLTNITVLKNRKTYTATLGSFDASNHHPQKNGNTDKNSWSYGRTSALPTGEYRMLGSRRIGRWQGYWDKSDVSKQTDNFEHWLMETRGYENKPRDEWYKHKKYAKKTDAFRAYSSCGNDAFLHYAYGVNLRRGLFTRKCLDDNSGTTTTLGRENGYPSWLFLKSFAHHLKKYHVFFEAPDQTNDANLIYQWAGMRHRSVGSVDGRSRLPISTPCAKIDGSKLTVETQQAKLFNPLYSRDQVVTQLVNVEVGIYYPPGVSVNIIIGSYSRHPDKGWLGAGKHWTNESRGHLAENTEPLLSYKYNSPDTISCLASAHTFPNSEEENSVFEHNFKVIMPLCQISSEGVHVTTLHSKEPPYVSEYEGNDLYVDFMVFENSKKLDFLRTKKGNKEVSVMINTGYQSDKEDNTLTLTQDGPDLYSLGAGFFSYSIYEDDFFIKPNILNFGNTLRLEFRDLFCRQVNPLIEFLDKLTTTLQLKRSDGIYPYWDEEYINDPYSIEFSESAKDYGGVYLANEGINLLANTLRYYNETSAFCTTTRNERLVGVHLWNFWINIVGKGDETDVENEYTELPKLDETLEVKRSLLLPNNMLKEEAIFDFSEANQGNVLRVDAMIQWGDNFKDDYFDSHAAAQSFDTGKSTTLSTLFIVTGSIMIVGGSGLFAYQVRRVRRGEDPDAFPTLSASS